MTDATFGPGEVAESAETKEVYLTPQESTVSNMSNIINSLILHVVFLAGR